MPATRPVLAAPAPSFGRRARGFVHGEPAPVTTRGDDARLFAMTFVGGFLFMSVYLA